jgi:PKD repeat protein
LNYYFDFGDGRATWQASGTIEYAYSTPGTYHASLIVMDELGVPSRNTGDKTITITFPPLIVYVVMKPTVVASGGTASVAVHITNGSYAIEGALVNVTSDKGGWFEADSGFTDADGNFVVNYTSPRVSTDTVVTIIVRAFKSGFTNSSEQVLFPVVIPSSNLFGLNSSMFWGAVIAAGTVVVIAVVLFRRRRIRNKRIARIRSRRS